METLDEIRLKIKSAVYKTKNKFIEGNHSKRFKSPIWSICDDIYDENDVKIPNAVFCTKCKNTFKYNSRSHGTSTILNHACLNDTNQTKIDAFATT